MLLMFENNISLKLKNFWISLKLFVYFKMIVWNFNLCNFLFLNFIVDILNCLNWNFNYFIC